MRVEPRNARIGLFMRETNPHFSSAASGGNRGKGRDAVHDDNGESADSWSRQKGEGGGVVCDTVSFILSDTTF